ncbi:M2 family metallopeptidase [Bacillus sp. SM2101]|uniref:M2 family metallopeptidase n=1 Tax=Bacillus sp. SM2101 TaxID=2805366 RepID=UPI001BDF6261|nr:M2 family metallopeptidase [Bacillus sp. SM2101]
MNHDKTDLILSLVNSKLQNKYQRYMQSLWMTLTSNNEKWVNQLEKDEKSYNKELSSPYLVQQINKLNREKYINRYHKRQVVSIYNEMLELSLNPTLQEKYTELWNEMHYRIATNTTEYNGKQIRETEVLRLLEVEEDIIKRKGLWFKYMSLGSKLSEGLLDLVNMRNVIAKEKGFNNFYELKLASQGLSSKELKSIIHHLRSSLDEDYRKIKENIDYQIKQQYGINDNSIRPWHYSHPFFQEYKLSYFKESDLSVDNILYKLKSWFNESGIDISGILKNSDISDNRHKSEANFCLNIDREKDVRISSNYHQNQKSLSLLMHELGHAVYEHNIRPGLPFILKKSSEIFMSEAIAIFFERLVYKKSWYCSVISGENAHTDAFVNRQDFIQNFLVKLYWTITLTTFEEELYSNPNQDLNDLWWSIVSDVQKIDRPPDCHIPVWAVKAHLTTLPVYYHNYLLGEVISSQLSTILERKFGFSDSHSSIQFLKENLFAYGNSLSWRDLLLKSFQGYLNPQYLISDIKRTLGG